MTLFELFGQAPVYFALICILSVLAVSISKSGFGGALVAHGMAADDAPAVARFLADQLERL